MLDRNRIYETTDYSLFTFRNNRDVNNKKGLREIAKLKESMRKFGWLDAPMCVSEIPENDNNSKYYKFYIESGQHRYMSAKETGTTIRYSVIKPYTIEQLVYINERHRIWDIPDTIDFYDSCGYSSYTYAKELCEKYPKYNTNLILNALSKSQGGASKDCMTNGRLYITNENYEMAKYKLDFLNEVNDYLSVKKGKREYQKSVMTLLEYNLIDRNRMIDKLSKYYDKLQLVASGDDAVRQLEIVYNTNVRGSNNIVNLYVPYKKLKMAKK